MSDKVFTKEEILAHKGKHFIFCPAIDHKKSVYKEIDVSIYIENLFGADTSWQTTGRIEGNKMLHCPTLKPLTER